MGFFGSDRSYNASSIEDLLKDDSLNIHENLSLVEAAYAYAAENEMNWNAIMEAVAMSEMEEMDRNGSNYSAVAEAGFFESVVNFFKKIWEKIKSLFKKFMVMIGSLVGKDKDFAKKHGDTIRKAINNIPNDAEIKGYKFTTDKLEGSISTATTNLVSWVTQIKDAKGDLTTFSNFNLDSDSYDVGDANDLMRGGLCTGMPGASASMTDSEMRQAAFEYARNNEDSPIDLKLDGSLVAKALADLDGGDKAKREANKLYSKQEKEWKTIMREAEKYNTKAYKDFPTDGTDKAKSDENTRLKKLSNALALCKSKASAIQTLCGVYLQAVKDEYSQCRKICAKVVTYKAAKEGASVTHYTESTHFTGINLI